MKPGAAELSLRLVGPGDRDLLLEWANDAATRAASLHPDPIDASTHDAWFAQRLPSPAGRIWIGEIRGHPIGQVRIDRIDSGGDARDGRGEVGISVASEARGLGLASRLLLAGMDAAVQALGVTTFVAVVRPENARSLALFREAGFSDDSEGVRDGIVCRILVRHGEPR